MNPHYRPHPPHAPGVPHAFDPTQCRWDAAHAARELEAQAAQTQADSGRRPSRTSTPRAISREDIAAVTQKAAPKAAADLNEAARRVAAAAARAQVGARSVRTKRLLRPAEVAIYQPENFRVGGNRNYGLDSANIVVTQGFVLRAWDRIYDRGSSIELIDYLRSEPLGVLVLKKLLTDWIAGHDLRRSSRSS